MIRLPYGISNLEKIVDEGNYFVDKTQYLELLENYESSYIFFMRPRRFGKSLFLSVLEHYYDINKKEKFDKLFNKYYIGKNPTALKNSYLILSFDFSGIATGDKETVYKGFRENVKIGVRIFCDRYNIKEKEYITKDGTPADILKKLFETVVESKINKKIYILIDEYDHFTNELLSFKYNLFEEVVTQAGFVRKFYEAIKTGTKTVVDRLFATGVTPITLDSFTSGFNIATNLSTNIQFHNMFGFTQDETNQVIKLCLEELGFNIDRVYEDMKQYYNGYLFNVKVEERIFNPDMVLYFLMNAKENRGYPDRIVDDNIMSDYSKLERSFKIGEKEDNYKALEKLVKEGEVRGKLTVTYSLKEKFSKDDFISLLYYLGIITIGEADLDEIKFIVPNYVIKQIYWDYFLKLIEDREKFQIDTDNISQAIKLIAIKNDFTDFIKIIEDFLGKLSKRDYIKFDEKYIKLIFILLMNISKIYYIKSEYEVDEGYVDIYLKEQEQIKVEYEHIIEIKYIKKIEYTEAKLKEKEENAEEQIRRYIKSQDLQVKAKLKKYIIIFVGSECRVCREIK